MSSDEKKLKMTKLENYLEFFQKIVRHKVLNTLYDIEVHRIRSASLKLNESSQTSLKVAEMLAKILTTPEMLESIFNLNPQQSLPSSIGKKSFVIKNLLRIIIAVDQWISDLVSRGQKEYDQVFGMKSPNPILLLSNLKNALEKKSYLHALHATQATAIDNQKAKVSGSTILENRGDNDDVFYYHLQREKVKLRKMIEDKEETLKVKKALADATELFQVKAFSLEANKFNSYHLTTFGVYLFYYFGWFLEIIFVGKSLPNICVLLDSPDKFTRLNNYSYLQRLLTNILVTSFWIDWPKWQGVDSHEYLSEKGFSNDINQPGRFKNFFKIYINSLFARLSVHIDKQDRTIVEFILENLIDEKYFDINKALE